MVDNQNNTLNCKICGMCCRVIILTVDKNALKEDAFLYKNFKKISKHCAVRINPYLKKWLKMMNFKSFRFYRCLQFDNVSNKCKAHDKKPLTCSGYPYYGEKELPKGFMLIHEDCVYQNKKGEKNV